MVGFKNETVLIHHVESQIEKLWGTKAYSQTELPYLGGVRVDLCVKTPRMLVAVEAKLYDWRRALAQAYGHRLAFDRTYVALPERLVKPHVVEEALSFDIGVICVRDDRCTIVQRAPSLQPNPMLRHQIHLHMKGGGD